MGSSFCKYENKENCGLVKNPCVPGQRGCVLKGRLNIQGSKLKVDHKTYKSRDIARFNNN